MMLAGAWSCMPIRGRYCNHVMSRDKSCDSHFVQISLSLEVAFRDGQLNVLVCLHDTAIPQVLVNHTELVTLSGNG